jgi:hypothetical protein
MKKISSFFYLVFFLLILISCTTKKPSAKTDVFVGVWYTIKGDVEEYSFYQDSTGGNYVGTLHDRPMVNGSWKVENNKLIMTPENGQVDAKSFPYAFVLKSDTLYLNGGAEIYTKTVPLYVQHPEVRILVWLKSELGLNFSLPKETEVKWFDETLKGYSVSLDSKLGSNDHSSIVEYISAYGFEPDTLYITEICNGYKTDYANDKILLTICTSQDPEATDGKVNITVSSAYKKLLNN